MRRWRALTYLLGVVCVVQLAIILALMRGPACQTTSVPNKMIDVGRALAVHQEQKQHMTKLVDHSRATSEILKESCFKAKARDRKLLEDVLRENAELREGRFQEQERQAQTTKKGDEARKEWDRKRGAEEVPRFGAVFPAHKSARNGSRDG